MTKTFLTADTHFGHAGVCRFLRDDGSKLRPWDNVSEMDEALIDNWNSVVGPDDKVYHLGDVAIPRRGLKCLEQLNGRKVLIRGNHDCLDTETEALTLTGWKKYDQLSKGDLIWSLKPSSGIGEWKPIDDIIIKDYNGQVVNFETKRMSMKMTPNHRFAYYKKYSEKHYGLKYITAMDMLNNKGPSVFRIKTAARSINTDSVPHNKDLLLLLAWIFTDGGFKGNQVVIYQSKPEGITRIQELLKSCSIDYKLNIRPSKPAGTIVCGKPLAKDSLEANEFIISSDHAKVIKDLINNDRTVIPSWFWDFSDDFIKEFVIELMAGDGSWGKSGTAGALHKSRKFLDQVMSLCVTHGINANLYKVRGRSCHALNINLRKTIKIYNLKQQLIQNNINESYYGGIVWCLSTEYTNFMVRRNGLSYFTGNCFKMSDYTKYFYDIRGCHYLDSYILTHIPVHPCNLTRYTGNIHGHLHFRRVQDEQGNIDPKYFCVCVEHTDYRPIEWEEVRAKLKSSV